MGVKQEINKKAFKFTLTYKCCKQTHFQFDLILTTVPLCKTIQIPISWLLMLIVMSNQPTFEADHDVHCFLSHLWVHCYHAVNWLNTDRQSYSSLSVRETKHSIVLAWKLFKQDVCKFFSFLFWRQTFVTFYKIVWLNLVGHHAELNKMNPHCSKCQLNQRSYFYYFEYVFSPLTHLIVNPDQAASVEPEQSGNTLLLKKDLYGCSEIQ